MAEWLTRTWFRFDVLLASLVLVVAAVLDPEMRQEEKLLLILVAPMGGLLLYLIVKAFVLIAIFIPVISIPVAITRIVYLWLFSRIVVEPTPRVDFPLSIRLWR